MKNNWVITIGREYCSGGAETARALAKELGYEYLDKELIDQTAALLEVTKDFVTEIDEQPGRKMTPLHWYLDEDEPTITLSDAAMVFSVQSDIIQKAANKGNCVIVGRCADYILENRPNTLSVFFCADMDKRITRATELFDLSREHAEHIIMKTDRNRAKFYNRNTTKRRWGQPKTYDLYLDLGELGTEGAIQAIITELKRRESLD